MTKKRRRRRFPSVSAQKPAARDQKIAGFIRPIEPALKAPSNSAGEATAAPRRPPERYAALDLGTNNCRLLIATRRSRSFRIIDAFSRIVRLGEGVSRTRALSDGAMDRALEALAICAEKIERRGVTRRRCIATQACRAASNGAEFLAKVRAETGLELEIIEPEEEARLSVAGCAELFDADAEAGIIFDIGGGSTEISWVRGVSGRRRGRLQTAAWQSMPVGVVSLSERFGGGDLSAETYAEIVTTVRTTIAGFGDPAGLRPLFSNGGAHLLGTSGTVTSIAGVHLELPRYRRDVVDGVWLTAGDVRQVTERLRAMSYEDRAREPCIGAERADLVVCGCAILEALMLEWPAERVRVADRGLREGILVGLAEQGRRRARRRRRKARA